MNSEGVAREASASDTQELEAIVRAVSDRFVIPEGVNRSLADFEEIARGGPSAYREIGMAFCFNIRALMSTVAIPYSLAESSALDRHHQRISTAARIRSLKLTQTEGETVGELEARRDHAARDQTDLDMRDFLSSREGNDALIRDVCTFLMRAIQSNAFAFAADELLLQGIVLCWGAFEVLGRDIFIAVLNLNPAYVADLVKDPVAKRRFELARVPLDTLLTHGFDLSAKMGTLLAEQQDLSDLNSLKAVFEALFPNADVLRDSLGDSDLRLLSLRRNVVVHRRGVIDEVYVKATGCSEHPGDRLRVAPSALESHVETVIRGATALFRALGAAPGNVGWDLVPADSRRSLALVRLSLGERPLKDSV